MDLSEKSFPTFNQIQEAMHVLRHIKCPIPKGVHDIALQAMSQYCDFHHPSAPDTGANVFWDEDGEFGHGSPSDVINQYAELKLTGAKFVCEVRRAVTLPSMFAIVTVDHGGEHEAVYFSSEGIARAQFEGQTAAPGSSP